MPLSFIRPPPGKVERCCRPQWSCSTLTFMAEAAALSFFCPKWYDTLPNDPATGSRQAGGTSALTRDRTGELPGGV